MEAKTKKQAEKVKSSAKKYLKKTVTKVVPQQSIAQKLKALKVGSPLSRYSIVFLPEKRKCDPIRKALSNDWEDLGQTWLNFEKNAQIDDCHDINIKTLLKKYNDEISENENNLIIIMNTICESILNVNTNFTNFDLDVHWDMQWIQNMYKIFGEVENENRREQKKNSATTEEKQNGPQWHEISNCFWRSCGDAFINDDKKMKNDLEKVLKAMQLGLFELQSVLAETNIGRKKCSVYAMHCHDGAYLVDKIESFTLPDETSDLNTIPHIMKRILCLKKRIINQVELLTNYLTLDTPRKEPRKIIQNVDVSFTSS
ncbi:20328_t:CDS:2 [Gigaspora margarita]|uniref:20328_t:CDS:1 n=1 Tax=Gigaspora margarita TaxID=4874 RepID=A0ABN7V6K8_GIGMA|nr:20328_t:CDS:2 [Gigaspora margarita]